MPRPDVLLLALCVGIGGVCPAADCRVQRVPNRILLIGCLAAAILQAVRLCFFPSEQALPWLFSMIAADVMAVLLYAGHLWGAGDSKLFAFSYLCFPISLLSDSTLTNSPISDNDNLITLLYISHTRSMVTRRHNISKCQK